MNFTNLTSSLRLRPRFVLPVVLAAAGLWAPEARSDVIQLADGRIMHGEIISGQTTEDGLAVRVFETGGVVMVRWDHVLAERAKKLRIEYGIDIPVEESVTRAGHVVTLTNGTQLRGVVENADEYQAGGSTLRLKTPTGIQNYERSRVDRIDSVSIEAQEAYTKDELYVMERDANPPSTATEHFALGDFCQRIGDYLHAKEHLAAAQADTEFLETPDGKSIDARLRRVDILLRAEAALDLVELINRAMYRKDWNQSLDTLRQLDEQFQDPQIRDAVGFDRLRSRVERGRSDYFRKEVALQVYVQMERLIESKVKEKKPLRLDDPGAAAMQGTLAGARMWAVRELPTALWERVATKLGLEQEELDAYWKDRSTRKVRNATYGTGSFIVIQRATLPGGNGRNRRRRPPGANPGGRGGNAGPNVEAAQPKTDEEWWDSVRAGDRRKWLEAYFVENSGLFNIVRTDESDLCGSCGGKGYNSSVGANGADSSSHCVQCNGAGKTKKVIYR